MHRPVRPHKCCLCIRTHSAWSLITQSCSCALMVMLPGAGPSEMDRCSTASLSCSQTVPWLMQATPHVTSERSTPFRWKSLESPLTLVSHIAPEGERLDILVLRHALEQLARSGGLDALTGVCGGPELSLPPSPCAWACTSANLSSFFQVLERVCLHACGGLTNYNIQEYKKVYGMNSLPRW